MTLDIDLADLLRELSSAQTELLAVLGEKRERMAAADLDGLARFEAREQELGERLETCRQRRAELLTRAEQENLPHESLEQLAAALPKEKRDPLGRQVRENSARIRLLQHQSLANWVLAQRTLLHLGQLLEIIASGGRIRPTYGNGESLHARGALVDREA